MSVTFSFRSILQQVTDEKLQELKLQKNLMTTHFDPILKQIENRGNGHSPKHLLELVYTAVKDSPVQNMIDSDLIKSLKYVLQNSVSDPSISNLLINDWIDKMKHEIQFSLRKSSYSHLFGSLLHEWLETEEKKRNKTGTPIHNDTRTQPAKIDLTTKKNEENKDKAIQRLSALMFTAPSEAEFEAERFRQFLAKELFDFGVDVDSEKTFLEIINETRNFFQVEGRSIYSFHVQECIKGLVTDELLSSEKKAALKELSENSEALDEVAGLLTSRLRNLHRWDWPQNISNEVTAVHRGLSGEYKTFLQEDMITALFLQYVGVTWATYFKRQFKRIYESRIWNKLECADASIEMERRDFYESAFLSALPDSMSSQANQHENEYVRVDGHPPPAKKMKCPCKRPSKPKIDFKQSFLHVLSTEIKLNQVIHPDKPFIVVQADLEEFGPSIIHDAALISLGFLGVPNHWLEFFKRFLQPKIKLSDKDGNPKSVLRGVPTSHVLSSLFGETQLFLLDFLVNRKCNGLRIYRIKDELWFWSPVPEDATKAWDAIQTYGKMMGLKVNDNRSGSVSVLSEEQISKLANPDKILSGPEPLPQRSIRWGYLELYSTGVFQIDEKAVPKFLEEMKSLLDKSQCVLEWTNVFNKYLDFFIRNFGTCATVSGVQHLDQIITALRAIYKGIFGHEDASPVEHLKQKYPKLQEANIIDAWAYWPLERGGLGLVNPFITVMSLREALVDLKDDGDFKKLPMDDKIVLADWKKWYTEHYGDFEEGMPTWEDLVGVRETHLNHWHQRYLRLLQQPEPMSPPESDAFWTFYDDEPHMDDETENYMLWLLNYYEGQMTTHFGSVRFISGNLLPASMIASINKTKVQH